jgi:multidrug resistance protein, MATE family
LTKQDKTVDFTQGSLWSNIWQMSWPMLVVMLFNFLVGLTDIYVAGFLGPEIQAIVGFVSQLYFFIIIVANAISIGAVAMISRAVGAGRQEEALSIARQSILFGTLCGFVLTGAGVIFHNLILSFAGFSENIGKMAAEFFMIFAFALTPNYIVILSTAVFRAGGEVGLTLLAMSFVSAINIALNFLLVFGIFSFPGFGYKGIALATSSAMFAGTIICLLLIRKSRWKRIFSGTWKVSSDLARRIFFVSWPAVVVQISWTASNVVLYNILSHIPDRSITAMAALTNGLRIEAIIYLPVFALNMAASVLTGQNLGAGTPLRAEKIGWKISLSGVTFVTLMALPIFLWAGEIVSPVSKDHQVLAETTRYLKITMFSEPFMALSVILGGCLQGAGDTRGVMFVIVSALWIVRLPLAYLLAVVAGHGAPGIWIAMVASMIVQGILMTLRFRNGRWKDERPWN